VAAEVTSAPAAPIEVLRTPDDRFTSLPDHPFAPRYVHVPVLPGSDRLLRVHHVDEGPPGAAPVLLMHGEPTWSFLYRHVIATLVGAGHRCVAPDLVGFGRSDKPASIADHSYARHVEWMRAALFDELDLRDITFVGQDWGGLIGLRLVAEHPERFVRVVVANTGLPTGDRPVTEAFLAWQRHAREAPSLPVGRLVAGGCATPPAPEVVDAYDAPFPDDTFTAGVRALPALVPTSPDDPAAADNRAAWASLRRFERPFLCAFSDGDPITRGGEKVFLRDVPGTAGQEHATITGGGHFLQEDRGAELGELVARFIERTRG